MTTSHKTFVTISEAVELKRREDARNANTENWSKAIILPIAPATAVWVTVTSESGVCIGVILTGKYREGGVKFSYAIARDGFITACSELDNCAPEAMEEAYFELCRRLWYVR